MEVSVFHRDGASFVAECRGHQIVTDSPAKADAPREAGMMPTELVLAALGTCAGYYARQFLLPHNIDFADMLVRVTCHIAKNPPRLDDFKIEVDVPGLPDELREGLHAAIEHCTVHNTLLHPPKMRINIVQGAAK